MPPLGGNAFPVWLRGSDANINRGISGVQVVAIRAGLFENTLVVNDSVSPSVDKRGYTFVSFYIPDTLTTTATKIRLQASFNNAMWFNARLNNEYIEETIPDTTPVSFSFDMLAGYPFIRLVFLNILNVQQVQSNLGIKYSLVV